MKEPYIKKVDDITIIDLDDYLVIINEKEQDKVKIYSLEKQLTNVTKTKSEIFEKIIKCLENEEKDNGK